MSYQLPMCSPAHIAMFRELPDCDLLAEVKSRYNLLATAGMCRDEPYARYLEVWQEVEKRGLDCRAKELIKAIKEDRRREKESKP